MLYTIRRSLQHEAERARFLFDRLFDQLFIKVVYLYCLWTSQFLSCATNVLIAAFVRPITVLFLAAIVTSRYRVASIAIVSISDFNLNLFKLDLFNMRHLLLFL